MNVLEIIRTATILQLCGASLSLVASSAILFMVRDSLFFSKRKASSGGGASSNRTKAKTPYRRLIVGLSISDVLQSLALVVGPFVPPKGTPQSPWAIGNTASCDAFGFIMLAGNMAVPMYSFALSIYYYCRVKYKMPNDVFFNKVEKKLHFTIAIFVVVVCFAALFTESLNAIPTGSACQVSSIPVGCRDNPNYECTRGTEAVVPFVWINMSVSFFCLIGIIVMMVLLCWNIVFRQNVTSGLNRRSTSNLRMGTTGSNDPQEEVAHEGWFRRRLVNSIALLTIFQDQRGDETEAMYLSRIYMAQMLLQCTYYVLSYICTFMFTWVMSGYYISGNAPPVWILCPLALFYSFGGALNILVFTRPKVHTLRIRYTELSWVKAFWLIVKHGGEIPSEDVILNRNRSREQSRQCEEPENGEYLFCCWGMVKILVDDVSSLQADSYWQQDHESAANEEESHEEEPEEEEEEEEERSLRSYDASTITSYTKNKVHSGQLLLAIQEEEEESGVEDSVAQDQNPAQQRHEAKLAYYNRIRKMVDGEDPDFSDEH
ncbi:hypothetical protein CTEN210_12480 [Chaetoceros tenuissimus]|uniref:Uncharacterized protein n=1 Tax=Chaetoceros tenuissimus TaxID=426638 RepID=A0AAD3D1J2_9STRA|nr:hypothetical protein CTEN210_12480 [Chaetoceros tenuissimus]